MYHIISDGAITKNKIYIENLFMGSLKNKELTLQLIPACSDYVNSFC